MKKNWKDIVFFICAGLVAIMLTFAIVGCQGDEKEHLKFVSMSLLTRPQRFVLTAI